MANSQDKLGELKEFHNELVEFTNLTSQHLGGNHLTKRENERASLLLVAIERKIGKLRHLIVELSEMEKVDIHGKEYDMWLIALSVPISKLGASALGYCIQATNRAIGKLEDDIRTGKRDVQGNLIEETRSIDARESPRTYENLGGRIVDNKFEVALQGTVDMAVECMMQFTKKLNSQGYSYRSSSRIGGHPDYAIPDRTCSATCTITETTEGAERQIGTIDLQLLPNERALLKTSHPQDWDSSFKHFMSALFTEFEQLGYIKEEKAATMSDSSPKVFNAQANWKAMEDEFGITKRAFGRAINFVSDDFKRKIIFRDVEHAYLLASHGFSKPAVILAGGVIEELLRLYLKYKKITPIDDNFDGYIKTCEQNGLLKSGISRLSDSVRHFRNLVHLSKEQTKRYTISKATAKGAVSSIFTIANDF